MVFAFLLMGGLLLLGTYFDVTYNYELIHAENIRWYHYITSGHTLALLYAHQFYLWLTLVFCISIGVAMKQGLEVERKSREK